MVNNLKIISIALSFSMLISSFLLFPQQVYGSSLGLSLGSSGENLQHNMQHEKKNNVVYLSNINYKFANTEWGKIEKDKNVVGQPLKIDNITYQKGLGTHANSEIIYDLYGRYQRFQAVVGPDDYTLTAPNLPTSIIFQVYADGEMLFDSGVMRTNPYSPAQFIDVDISGKKELRLVVNDAGDDRYSDQANWADACLIREGKLWENISGDYYDWKETRQPERPYIHDYSKTMTMKIMMAKQDGKGSSNVICSMEDALEYIKKTDIVTRGIPKIVYLVGWQFNGHDDKYPSWEVVNPKLKREQDATATESLIWLMDEAEKYNTTVSLHINMRTAYDDSPLWDTYVENDLISKNANGSLVDNGKEAGKTAYQICHKAEWESGYAVKRIDDLLEMLPIERAGTIHIDAFFVGECKAHGATDAIQQEYRRKIVRYWRERGIDVTSEFLYSETGSDDLIGLIPMVWWLNQPKKAWLERPADLLSGGCVNTDFLGESGDGVWGFLFGENMHGEPFYASRTFQENANPYWGNEFMKEFCLRTLPFYYQNLFQRESVSGILNSRQAKYSDGLILKYKDRSIFHNDRLLRTEDNVFIPALWRDNKEIIAFSRLGYTDKKWTLPNNWSDISHVDIYSITPDGLLLIEKAKPIQNMTLSLTLACGETLSIVPAGTTMENVIHIDTEDAVYLSDIPWVSATTEKWNVEKDISNSGHPIKINGMRFKKGLGTHANSEIIYHLSGNYKRFKSTIGPDDYVFTNTNYPTSIVFKVYGDNELLYNSGIMRSKPYSGPQHIDLDIAGVNELKLIVEDAGDDRYSDQASWGGARLIQ